MSLPAQLPVIQSLWIGKSLSRLEQLCIQSFIDHGHEFHLYAYADIAGMPHGATIKDANSILPESEIFTYRGGSYAGFSNWFRYALLAKCGGFYVDMDTVCIRPFDFGEDIVLNNSVVNPTDSAFISTNPICMPKGHPLMHDMEKFCREFPNKQGSKFTSVGGGAVLTRFVLQHNCQHYAKPWHHFAPVATERWHSIYDSTYAGCGNLFESTHSVHCFNDMLRRYGLDKDARFDSDSLYEQLKAKHKIANAPNAPSMSAKVAAALQHAAAKRRNRINRERGLFLAIAFGLGLAIGLAF